MWLFGLTSSTRPKTICIPQYAVLGRLHDKIVNFNSDSNNDYYADDHNLTNSYW